VGASTIGPRSLWVPRCQANESWILNGYRSISHRRTLGIFERGEPDTGKRDRMRILCKQISTWGRACLFEADRVSEGVSRDVPFSFFGGDGLILVPAVF